MKFWLRAWACDLFAVVLIVMALQGNEAALTIFTIIQWIIIVAIGLLWLLDHADDPKAQKLLRETAMTHSGSHWRIYDIITDMGLLLAMVALGMWITFTFSFLLFQWKWGLFARGAGVKA
jgi:hypothetical protein